MAAASRRPGRSATFIRLLHGLSKLRLSAPVQGPSQKRGVDPMISTKHDTEKHASEDLVSVRLGLPEAALFSITNETTIEPTSAVTATMEAAADMVAGESIVVSAGVGGGLLLVRRRYRRPQ